MEAPRRASWANRHLDRPDLITAIFGAALVCSLAMVGLQVGSISAPDPKMQANGTTITGALHLDQGSYQLRWSTHSNVCVNADGSSTRGSVQVELVDGAKQTASESSDLQQHVILSSSQLTSGSGTSNFEVFSSGYYKLAVASCGPWRLSIHRLSGS